MSSLTSSKGHPSIRPSWWGFTLSVGVLVRLKPTWKLALTLLELGEKDSFSTSTFRLPPTKKPNVVTLKYRRCSPCGQN
ncbi:unnamed protein product, partial [Ixodes pacificus]